MKKRMSIKAALIAITTIILFVLFNPLSLFFELIVLSRMDPAFVWHLWQLLKQNATGVAVIIFWIVILLLIAKLRESAE